MIMGKKKSTGRLLHGHYVVAPIPAVSIDEATALARKEVAGTHLLSYADYRKVCKGLVQIMETLDARRIRL